jgi:deoxyribonuclease-1-like protein
VAAPSASASPSYAESRLTSTRNASEESNAFRDARDFEVQPDGYANSSLPGSFRSSGTASSSDVRNPPIGKPVSSSHRIGLNQQYQAPTLRIASFDMHAFGESKVRRAIVVESISRMLRQYDVIAIQHIQARQHSALPELIDKVNEGDRRYEYCLGPKVGPEGSQQHFAFVFDSDRIETDRQMLYTVDDPQRLMDYEPLVGWFRSKQVSASQAFTFSLVNIKIDPISGEREVAMLPSLLKSIRQDGRLEDDIIFAGNFGCSDRELTSLKSAGMIFALEGVPTSVSGDAMLDNIAFPTRATDEFTGRSGVLDFLRKANLSIDQAFQISTHMPIWAEFYATEGGIDGPMSGSR